MIKAIFFDIDWTLMSHKVGKISDATMQAIATMRQNGIKCVLATGRNFYEIRQLQIPTHKFDATIALNGQIITDQQDKVLQKYTIKNADPLIEVFNQKEVPMMFVEDDIAYVNFMSTQVEEAMTAISTAIPPVMPYTNNEVLQAILFADEDEAPKHLHKFPGFDFLRWHPYAVDIVINGIDKVAGVKKYCKMLNITQEETMAFGDGDNDVKMLEWADIGVAMDNANNAVKNAADFITKDVDEDGVVHALKHFGLI